MRFAFFIAVFFPAALLAQQVYSVQELKDGKFKEDSSHVYNLPFEHGKKVFLVQGYESLFSHKGSRALDFKVKTGTRVCAARAGVVTAMRKDSDKRGLKPENLSDGNYIIIQHIDGSEANYWHFKKDGILVSIGDTVTAGQVIGLSGNTGYSAFPHLHFEVRGYDAATDQYTQLATRFTTRNGVLYLRPGKFYRSRHD
jgi:murein DD-endopeptidase MepM/ murein hydrolase activator NlpD